MNKFFLAFSLGIVAIALQSVQAHAQNQQQRSCGERGAIVASLADKYGESAQGIGLAANNSVIEVYASGETGTWTIIVTMPNGTTCLVATGQSWEAMQTGQIKPGEDA